MPRRDGESRREGILRGPVRTVVGGNCTVRKRHFLLAAGAVAAGLAILGTVAAQQPAGGRTPPPGYRPYSEWTPYPQGSAPTEPVQPTGGYLPVPAQPQTPAQTVRPRLSSNAVMAGADGVRPITIPLPPPNMELSPATPTIPPTPPSSARTCRRRTWRSSRPLRWACRLCRQAWCRCRQFRTGGWPHQPFPRFHQSRSHRQAAWPRPVLCHPYRRRPPSPPLRRP